MDDDVTMRGKPRGAGQFRRFCLATCTGVCYYADPGDVTLYNAGYVVVTSGWQGDLPIDSVGTGREGINVPVAKNPDGSSILGRVVVRFASDVPGYELVNFSGNVNTLSLPGPGRSPASLDTTKATLISKTSETQSGVSGGVVTIPATEWAFADCRTSPFPGKPDATRVCLKDGFHPERLYQLVYTAKDPLVLGAG